MRSRGRGTNNERRCSSSEARDPVMGGNATGEVCSGDVAVEPRRKRVGEAQKRFISGWTKAENNQAEPLGGGVGTIETVDSTEDVRLVCWWC